MIALPTAAVRRSIEAIQTVGSSRIGRLPGVSVVTRAAENRLVPKLAEASFRPGEHDVNGVRIIIPDSNGQGGEPYMVLGLYERSEVRYLRRRLRPGGGMVDIGAHIGYLSLQAASAVGPSGLVLAVEPTPQSAALLRRAVAANGFDDRVRVVEAAASDHSGTGTLRTSHGNAMWNTLDAADDKTYDSVDVRLVTIDELLTEADWPTIDLIKIDVEGHEKAVLAGAGETIERYPNVEMVFELQGSEPTLRTSSDETIAHFDAMGFRFHRLSSRGSLIPATPDDLRAQIRLPRWQDSLFNVVATRGAPRAELLDHA